MFIPATRQEMKARGWQALDVVLVTGDAYIDSPFMGVALIGQVLMAHGCRVGIIAQPDTGSDRDIARLGEPGLFWGVTGGCVDSMVANYTALKKRRKTDDYTPGGVNDQRPDRAVIVYANLIRRYFKPTRPIVLGGIEASLRRIAHYDFWSDRVRRSILLDAKADYLLYGMAHASVLELAKALKQTRTTEDVKGLAWISKTPKGVEMPSFEAVRDGRDEFIRAFRMFYGNNDPATAQTLCQRHNDRYLVINPPGPRSEASDLDLIHGLPFERNLHPLHHPRGTVRALDTIRFAIPTHYGCYGECRFCAISVHQGRTVQSRSPASILREAEIISRLDGFKGYIHDLGGPTANMYGYECRRKLSHGACKDRSCLFPSVCKSLRPDHSAYLDLIQRVEQVPGVKKVFIGSGIRYDLIVNDLRHGPAFLEKIVQDNVSGQMKIAPEHCVPHVLNLMGKPSMDHLTAFKLEFDRLTRKAGKKQFLTYYLMAAHPGCTLADMRTLARFTREKLRARPEQVQIFTPTPSTWSTLMYHTKTDPFSMTPLFVEKEAGQKDRQKKTLI